MQTKEQLEDKLHKARIFLILSTAVSKDLDWCLAHRDKWDYGGVEGKGGVL